jgi:ABC-2 type transport system permease protein
MSTTATKPRAMAPVDRSQLRPPSLVRLTRVEMRKMVDTRSGFWLLLVIGLLSAAFVVINLFAGPDENRTFDQFFQGSLFPVGVLLPVLGILMVTSEWSQRTTLSTFTLVPKRLRITLAKIFAGTSYAVLSLISSLVFATAGFGLAEGLGRAAAGSTWSIEVTALAGAVLFQVMGMLSGLAFGLILLNTPAAIVLSFVLPTGLTILGSAIKSISDWVVWLDINQPAANLTENSMTGDDWKHLATASLLWIWVPLALGSLRLIRREVK